MGAHCEPSQTWVHPRRLQKFIAGRLALCSCFDRSVPWVRASSTALRGDLAGVSGRSVARLEKTGSEDPAPGFLFGLPLRDMSQELCILWSKAAAPTSGHR